MQGFDPDATVSVQSITGRPKARPVPQDAPMGGANMNLLPAVCRGCGAPVPPDKRFCPRCGTPVDRTPPPHPDRPVKYCLGCGAPLTPGKKFCARCGKPTSPSRLVDSPEPENGATPPAGPALCKYCGAPIKPGKKFCSVCGSPAAEQPAEKTCSYCGTKITDGKAFCPLCGMPVK
jgi:predicted amidophosphoribosyltransferase